MGTSKLMERGRSLLPITGYHFDRPIVVFQSDDWGRVGLRDREGLEQLRSAGLALGERPYDFYTLETADDLAAVREVLQRHRDSAGQHPSIGMNFIAANLDFAQLLSDPANQLRLVPLAEGLPAGWNRPGLLQAYREGINEGLFRPSLHGTTHFCRAAIDHALGHAKERTDLLHTLWRAGTPYIHWRMPWVGYEYWNPEKPEEERFLPAEAQSWLIGEAVGIFAKLFAKLPASACAPGYRANDETYRAWAQHGIRVAQNGPGALVPPYFDRNELLHVCRTVEFEPATDLNVSVEKCLQQAQQSFEQGLPAIVTVHSINFHSTVRDFRSRTLQVLDEFLTALESRFGNLLYLHDDDLYSVVSSGTSVAGERIGVKKKLFTFRSAGRS